MPPTATTRSGSARDGLVEEVEPELAVVVHRQHAEDRPGALCGRLPRHEVRVVLELRREDDVTRPQVVGTPGVGDEVQRLGRIAHEDDLT